jgi:hypothetical protein
MPPDLQSGPFDRSGIPPTTYGDRRKAMLEDTRDRHRAIREDTNDRHRRSAKNTVTNFQRTDRPFVALRLPNDQKTRFKWGPAGAKIA